jgi:hypothetical protein
LPPVCRHADEQGNRQRDEEPIERWRQGRGRGRARVVRQRARDDRARRRGRRLADGAAGEAIGANRDSPRCVVRRA